ncbi:hypothetical protein UFOVP46_95 [uncultured Caudovirales phage]|uniref:Uncharacterized protein n=1 Tax=uncultured Caudovirales phage TaxID=2100421 RepID=A0A6J5KRA5_9CAUD|nr:hypothetical protein UFOVP46_95 [uncultured Caudovirales phage]
MAKYEIKWTRELWLKVTIEAESEQHAIDKFWDGEFDNEQQYGSEIQQDIDIREEEQY